MIVLCNVYFKKNRPQPQRYAYPQKHSTSLKRHVVQEDPEMRDLSILLLAKERFKSEPLDNQDFVFCGSGASAFYQIL